MPGATLRRPLIAAAATFALGASPVAVASAHDTGSTTAPQLEVRVLAVHGHRVSVAVWTSRGSLRGVTLTLRRNGEVVVRHRLTRPLTPRHRTVDFTVAETGGRLTVTARAEEHRRVPRAHTTSTTSS